jgi:hypothetical protein
MSEEAATQAFIKRFVAVCEADVRVAALLLIGSRASGRSDRFSDLDLLLVTTDAAYDAVLAGREELLRSLGEPQLLEDFDIPGIAFVMYADGVDLELNFARVGDLRLAAPHRVLLDKADVMEGVVQVPAKEVDRERLRRQLHWFWHDLSHLITALGRGHTWWAYGQLDDLRRSCLNLALMVADPTAEPEGYWKADALVPADDLAELAATRVPAEQAAMLEAARVLLAFHRRRGRELAERHGLDYPVELDRLVSAKLEQLDSQ